MKKILLAILMCLMLSTIVSAVTFRTGASDGAVFAQTGQGTPIPSTVTIVPQLGGTPITQDAKTPPAYATNFNVNFNVEYDVSYVAPGYKSDIDNFWFDSQLQNCVPGSNCNMATDYFVTDCKWNSTFSDWVCRNTDTVTNQWISFIYNKNDPVWGEVIRAFNLMYPDVPSNHKPVINPIGSKSVLEGQLLQFTISGNDVDGDPLTYDTGDIAPLPVGAIFDQNSKTFTWTPSFTQSGSYQVTFWVRDPFGAYDSETITITVTDVVSNGAPVFTSTPITAAVVNQQYVYDADATDPNGDVLSFSLSVSPAGMSINSVSGVISWTPSNAQLGSHNVVVSVSDGTFTTLQSYSVTVTQSGGNLPPYFTSTPITAAVVNQQYSYDANAVDPEGSILTFSISNGPSGMVINPVTGLISFTPQSSQVGSFPVVVTVADGTFSVTQAYTLTVSSGSVGNHAPYFTSSPVLKASPGKVYVYDADAFDADGDVLSFSLVSAPLNMTINSNSGVITWIPPRTGNYHVTVAVTDGKFVTTQSYSINSDNFFSGVARKVLAVTRINTRGECYSPGDSVPVFTSAENRADEDLEDVRYTVSIPELGIREQAGPFKIRDGRSTSQEAHLDLPLFINIPYDAPSGEYNVRIVMSNDDVRRVKDRPIIVGDC